MVRRTHAPAEDAHRRAGAPRGANSRLAQHHAHQISERVPAGALCGDSLHRRRSYLSEGPAASAAG